MSGSAKWFDLSDHDCKLERRDTDGASHYKLMLEVPAARLEPLIPEDPRRSVSEALLDIGWHTEAVGADRYRLTNHAPMNRKSEIVAALRPFFSEQEIEGAHVSVHALRQGERVEGLQARRVITQAELEGDIEGVEVADFERIAASVRRAQALQADRERKQRQVLFDGKGRQLYGHLTDLIASKPGWGEAEAAFAAMEQMRQAAAAPRSVHAVRLTDLAKALDGGTPEETASGESYVLGRIGDAGEVRENARFAAAMKGYAANRHGPLVSVRDALLDEGGALAPEAMDRVEVKVSDEEAFAYYRERLPFMVIRDTSVPTRVLAQNMAAVDATLDLVAEELELPRDALVPRQRTVPLRFSYDAISANEADVGELQRIESDEPQDGEDDRAALTMNISVMRGRSFTHELGHLVDRGNGLSDEERHGILSRSGVLVEARTAVNRAFPDGGAYADYLLSEPEVFARAFDAHVVNVVRARGDDELRAVGGLQTTQGFHHAAPFGDLDRTNSFMAELKEVLVLRREARHEARQKASAQAAPEAVGAASFGMG
jgi:hypothetical protein